MSLLWALGRPVVRRPVTPEARWQAFAKDGLQSQAGGQFVGDEIVQIYTYLEKLAHQYTDPAFWDGRGEDQAALTSLLNMLRFLMAQIGQTVHEAVWIDDAS